MITDWPPVLRERARDPPGLLDHHLAGYQPRWGEEVSLRMIMVHVFVEYGRHSGHADLLREGADGTVGA
ncbi:hypothetical protein AMK21_29660 [Streptomyces sp. CB00316]|nr:hypothetical protein AMK21_29660 [Streptomyces sp. CB00316]